MAAMGRDELTSFLDNDGESWGGCEGDVRAVSGAPGILPGASRSVGHDRIGSFRIMDDATRWSRVSSISSQVRLGVCETKRGTWDSPPLLIMERMGFLKVLNAVLGVTC